MSLHVSFIVALLRTIFTMLYCYPFLQLVVCHIPIFSGSFTGTIATIDGPFGTYYSKQLLLNQSAGCLDLTAPCNSSFLSLMLHSRNDLDLSDRILERLLLEPWNVWALGLKCVDSDVT